MADEATAKYLSANVGPVLAQALAEMTTSQPLDGVGFLSQWLKTYAAQQEEKEAKDLEELALAEERKISQQRLKDRNDRQNKVKQELGRKEKLHKDLKEKFESEPFDPCFFEELVTVAKEVTGAEAVYLGVSDDAGIVLSDQTEKCGPCLRYVTAKSTPAPAERPDQRPRTTTDFENLVLLKDPEGGQGVTWGVFDEYAEKPTDEQIKEKFLWLEGLEIPPPPPAEPVDGEPPADPDAPPPLPTYPKHLPVYIECVTDCDKVHFFQMTRLGAYLAIPLVYRSYYQEASLAEAKTIVETWQKDQAEKKLAEEQADPLAADATKSPSVSPAPVSNTPDPGPVTEVLEAKADEEMPEPELTPVPGSDFKMVLCLDTLGANTAFEMPKTIVKLFELCKAAADSKSLKEKREIVSQVQAQLKLKEQQLPPLEAEVQTKLDQDKSEDSKLVEEELKPMEEELKLQEEHKDVRRALLNAKHEFLAARELLLARKEELMKLRDWMVVRPEVLNTLTAAALLMGFKKEELLPLRKDFACLSWEKLRLILDEPFFKKINEIQVSPQWVRKGLQEEQTMKYIDANFMDKVGDAEKAEEDGTAFVDFWNFLQKARALRLADLEWRKKHYELEKAAKLEAGEDYSRVITDEDDDITE